MSFAWKYKNDAIVPRTWHGNLLGHVDDQWCDALSQAELAVSAITECKHLTLWIGQE